MSEQSARLTDLENNIRNAITQEGIDSLDALVRRLASSSLARFHNEDRLFMVAEVMWRTGPDSALPKPHRPPEMDLFIDGERSEPSKVSEFNGRVVYIQLRG
jgi:hypothetical protein